MAKTTSPITSIDAGQSEGTSECIKWYVTGIGIVFAATVSVDVTRRIMSDNGGFRSSIVVTPGTIPCQQGRGWSSQPSIKSSSADGRGCVLPAAVAIKTNIAQEKTSRVMILK